MLFSYVSTTVPLASKVQPITGHDGTGGEVAVWLYSFFNLGAIRSWSTPQLGRLTQGKAQVPTAQEAGSERVRKISPPPEIGSSDRPARS